MYDKELAMALLISSTCLLGIIGASYPRFRFKSRKLFAIIMLLSLNVIALSLAWFTSPSKGLLSAMTIVFACQVIAFTLLYVIIPIMTESEVERYQRWTEEKLESKLRERRGKARAKNQAPENNVQKTDDSKQ